MSSADPLAFFAEGDDSSSSEDEEATEWRTKAPKKAEESEGNDGDKLPSPDTLFRSVGRPSFLDDPKERYIDWDRFVKSSEPDEPNVHQTGHYTAIPPPSGLGEHGPGRVTGSAARGSASVEYSARPITYDRDTATSGAPSLDSDPYGKKRQQEARGNEADLEGERSGPSSKKAKTDNFRQKEKRKRDLGQSSRGKSYVEEEKRILRQQFAADEIPS